MNRTNAGRLLLIALVLAAATACGPKNVRTTVLVPAKSTAAAGLRRLAVIPFDGPYGDVVSARVESLLASVRIGGQPYFTLVDRAQFDRVLDEQALALDPAMDPRTAARLGKLAGAQGILTGNVLRAGAEDGFFQREETICTVKDVNGACVRWGTRHIPCRSRTARVEVSFRLTDASTGVLAYASSMDDERSASACAGGRLPDPDGMVIGLIDRLAERFRMEVAPHREKVSLALMGADPVVKGDPRLKERFKGAVEYADADRLDQACRIWEEGAESAPDSPALQFNVGVCDEVAGRIEPALEHYRKADELLGKPNKLVTRALERARKRQLQVEKLRRQVPQE